MLAHLVYFIPQGHEVAESLRLVLGLTEQGGGVERPHEEDAVLLNKGAVLLRHRKVGAYHPLGGDAAQADDDFRPTALLKKSNYFGTMLVKMGKADCLLGGATYSTADTIRPALQLVKTKKGAHLVSSCFILDRDCGEEGLKRIAMGDCAVNIDYTDTVDKATGEVKVAASAKLAEVAVETAKTAKLFGIDPKVAVLSFSTKGSGKGGTVALSHDAVIKAQEMAPELAIDGELQFDAAVAPEVAQVKCKGSKVAGQANTFIFPCIEAGNIGYKIAQRLGGYAAYGPILQGLNAPINDLSRGCNADEVYKMSLITACQS